MKTIKFFSIISLSFVLLLTACDGGLSGKNANKATSTPEVIQRPEATQDVAATVAAILTAIPTETTTPVLTATNVPNTPTVESTTPTNSLKYDQEGCDSSNFKACVPPAQWAWYQQDSAKRLLFPAQYLQQAQDGILTPGEAITQIQQMAAGWAITWDKWASHDVDRVWPTLIWNPQRSTCSYVPDTAFPLLQAKGVPTEWYHSVAVVQSHTPADPKAGQIQVVCTTNDNWAVLLH
jgi:hypothetical protein